jgi:hypothetical protein
MTRNQLIFDIAVEAYGDLAEASQILNRNAALSARERECRKRVRAAFEKVGDIREVCLGRLSADYTQRHPPA